MLPDPPDSAWTFLPQQLAGSPVFHRIQKIDNNGRRENIILRPPVQNLDIQNGIGTKQAGQHSGIRRMHQHRIGQTVLLHHALDHVDGENIVAPLGKGDGQCREKKISGLNFLRVIDHRHYNDGARCRSAIGGIIL